MDEYKIGKRMNFYFEHPKEDIIMSEENEKDFRNNKIFRICGKET